MKSRAGRTAALAAAVVLGGIAGAAVQAPVGQQTQAPVTAVRDGTTVPTTTRTPAPARSANTQLAIVKRATHRNRRRRRGLNPRGNWVGRKSRGQLVYYFRFST